jgi:hypothetical protein
MSHKKPGFSEKPSFLTSKRGLLGAGGFGESIFLRVLLGFVIGSSKILAAVSLVK